MSEHSGDTQSNRPPSQDTRIVKKFSQRTFRAMPRRLRERLDSTSFVPDSQRSYDYLHLDRPENTHNPDFLIPIGKYDFIHYKGYEQGKRNDRSLGSYQTVLYPEDFEDILEREPSSKGWSAELMLIEMKRRANPQSIWGGYDEAFLPGKTVLNVGSGQAFALMQLSLQYPQTAFVGVDILYDKERNIYPQRPGLQLTKGDWRELKSIPDQSVDTILSLAGIGFWGLSQHKHNSATREDDQRIISALTRVAKPGATLRISTVPDVDFLTSNMEPNWEVKAINHDYKGQVINDLFIARKK